VGFLCDEGINVSARLPDVIERDFGIALRNLRVRLFVSSSMYEPLERNSSRVSQSREREPTRLSAFEIALKGTGRDVGCLREGCSAAKPGSDFLLAKDESRIF
jgi:hypothetical protein